MELYRFKSMHEHARVMSVLMIPKNSINFSFVTPKIDGDCRAILGTPKIGKMMIMSDITEFLSFKKTVIYNVGMGGMVMYSFCKKIKLKKYIF